MLYLNFVRKLLSVDFNSETKGEIQKVKIKNLRTKAKPPMQISQRRHNVILSNLMDFGGGLTPMPNPCRQD